MPTKGPEDYLEIAQAAEKAADVADSVQARQSWQAIAKEYRALGSREVEAAARADAALLDRPPRGFKST
jgi:hypothetical protein